MEENKKREWYKDAIVKRVQESNNLQWLKLIHIYVTHLKEKESQSMKNEEITWYKNRIIKLVKESEDLRLLKLIHRIAENLLGTVKER